MSENSLGTLLWIPSFGKEKDTFYGIPEDRKRPIDGHYGNEVISSREERIFL